MAPDSGHMPTGRGSLREEPKAKHKEPKLSTKSSAPKEDRQSQAGLAFVASLLVYQEHLRQRVRSILFEDI